MVEVAERSLVAHEGRARSGRRARRARRAATAWSLSLVFAANAIAIVWLWVHGGNVTDVRSAGDALTSLGRLTGLLGAYSALVQVLLLARLPPLERLVGFDRLSVWHRLNGHATRIVVTRPAPSSVRR